MSIHLLLQILKMRPALLGSKLEALHGVFIHDPAAPVVWLKARNTTDTSDDSEAASERRPQQPNGRAVSFHRTAPAPAAAAAEQPNAPALGCIEVTVSSGLGVSTLIRLSS
jgi:hypothetical protein